MKKTTVVALVLTALGLILVAIAAVLEARSYPWRLRLGLPAQDAAALPEPSPIVPDEEEAVVVYLEAVETPAGQQAGEAPAEMPDILPGAEEDTAEEETPAESAPAQKQYTVIGTLKIPVLRVSQNILEGTGKELKYGVGRLTLSAYPGQKGNCVIAGHRPYPFRYLDLLNAGDIITIRFNGATYTYSVYESIEVLPTETWVLSPVKGHPYTLTLITCTPYLVSSHRLIVRAELTEIDGVPFEDPDAAPAEETSAPPDIETGGEGAVGESAAPDGEKGGEDTGGESAPTDAGGAGGESAPGEGETGAATDSGETDTTPGAAGGAADGDAPAPDSAAGGAESGSAPAHGLDGAAGSAAPEAAG